MKKYWATTFAMYMWWVRALTELDLLKTPGRRSTDNWGWDLFTSREYKRWLVRLLNGIHPVITKPPAGLLAWQMCQWYRAIPRIGNCTGGGYPQEWLAEVGICRLVNPKIGKTQCGGARVCTWPSSPCCALLNMAFWWSYITSAHWFLDGVIRKLGEGMPVEACCLKFSGTFDLVNNHSRS